MTVAGQPRDGLASSLSPEFLTELLHDPLDPGYAAAAAARTAEPAPWRRRLGRSVTLVTLMVVGLLLAVAYQQVVREEPTRTQVRDDLREQIQQQDATTTSLQQRVEDLGDEVARLRDRQLGGRQAQQLRGMEAATGLARVQGDGVVVQVADGPEQLDPATGTPVAEARILDYDLQQIANTLWAAGAEAIAINDRRLTATSTIRSASGAILVNGLPVAAPYRVSAVGPAELMERFATSGTGQYLQELVNRYGISYDVRDRDDLSLPAAVTPDLHHAAPAGAASPPTGGNR